MHTNELVIIEGARTPMGSFQGSLSTVTAPQLGATAIKEAIKRSKVSQDDIDEVIMGCVLSAGLKQGPARQAALLAGLPNSVACTTINKLCGSGMKAVMQICDALQAGSVEIAIAGGMESMSNAPYLATKAREGIRMGHSELKDHMFLDGLEDAETGHLMGTFAQEMADRKGISREDMDAFAIESLQRAQKAIENSWCNSEIVPVTIKTRKGEITVTTDEQPSKANIGKIPHLKPAFAKNGTITAANSSSISDGASAMVLTTAAVAKAKGLAPSARILARATQSQHPSEFTAAPIGALGKVLDKAGWQTTDVDLYEINEAFAMVAMMPVQEYKLDPNTVNIFGGACALGHPVGSTGSRIILTLINALRHQQKTKGVATLCIGGGEATAVAIELL